MTKPARWLAGLLGAAGLGAGLRAAPALYEQPPVSYSRTQAHDPVSKLLARIAAGQVVLRGTDADILKTVLRELEIPVESQVVVFSKTSMQAGLIQPSHPRAIYFSDSAYVGWVPGALVEAAAIDPELGPVFYSFDPEDARDGRRTFVRERTCLRCHGGTLSRDFPALFTRSLAVDKSGEPFPGQGPQLMDDSTPFDLRWGGWYVTGYAGTENHRGNAFAAAQGDGFSVRPSAARPGELSGFFDTSQYLAPTSDVVALLVLEHQTTMHNSLTRAGQRVRRAPADPAVLADAVQDVLDHLLFRDAAAVPEPLGGNAAFRRAFAAPARRDRAGDSLRDFSGEGRLFANRCSYLIYADSFAALPAPLESAVLGRLAAVLRGEDPAGRYAYLGAGERGRIASILAETLPAAQPYLHPGA